MLSNTYHFATTLVIPLFFSRGLASCLVVLYKNSTEKVNLNPLLSARTTKATLGIVAVSDVR